MCTVYGLKNKTPRISYTVHEPGLGKHMTTLEEGNMDRRAGVKGEPVRAFPRKLAIFREHLYNMGHR